MKLIWPPEFTVAKGKIIKENDRVEFYNARGKEMNVIYCYRRNINTLAGIGIVWSAKETS